MKAIICLECRMYGARSSLKILETISYEGDKKLFWDEDGKKHVHNSAYNKQVFACSNGHTFDIINLSGPCICGWVMDPPKL